MIYLDNAATTQVKKDAIDAMNEVMIKDYGNPSSIHSMGLDAEKKVKTSRSIIQKAINVSQVDGKIIFTSGGTESNNLAIRGVAIRKNELNHFITTSIEHTSVMECFKYLESKGHEVTYLNVDKNGLVSSSELRDAIRENTRLISIMHVNNEVGAIQPIEELVQITKKINPNCLFHSDGVQAFCKIDTDIKKLGVDLYSMSSHKIHGPKGTGALFIKKGVNLSPVLFGSGQEYGYRAGTENVVGIVGFGVATNIVYSDLSNNKKRLKSIKTQFWNKLSSHIDDIYINGDLETGASHIINISFCDMRAEVLVHEFADNGLMASTGSACSSKKKIYSRILGAMNIEESKKMGAIRFSFNPYMSDKDIDNATDIIIDAYKKLVPIMKG